MASEWCIAPDRHVQRAVNVLPQHHESANLLFLLQLTTFPHHLCKRRERSWKKSAEKNLLPLHIWFALCFLRDVHGEVYPIGFSPIKQFVS